MRGKISMQMVNMRHRKAVLDLAHDLTGLPGVSALPEGVIDRAADAYLAVAVRDEFGIGTGAGRVARLAACFGIGFLQDRQYPQLRVLFRGDIKADEPWRLALLDAWYSYATGRAGPFLPQHSHARLQRLAGIIQQHGADGLTVDPAALFAAIDPAKASLHKNAVWQAIHSAWHAEFTQSLHGAGAAQLDYACALAFCCGQHFAFDPLWDKLSDLNPESLYQFLK